MFELLNQLNIGKFNIIPSKVGTLDREEILSKVSYDDAINAIKEIASQMEVNIRSILITPKQNNISSIVVVYNIL